MSGEWPEVCSTCEYDCHPRWLYCPRCGADMGGGIRASLFSQLLKRLRLVEERFTKGVKDNMRVNTVHLRLFPDGSGMVDAEWSKYKKDACLEENLLHTIFSEESALFEFSNIEELSAWLDKMIPEEEPHDDKDGR